MGTETPVDLGVVLITFGLPSVDFLPQGGDIWNLAIQALRTQHRELAFGHLQPTAMFGRVVDSNLHVIRRASAGGQVS